MDIRSLNDYMDEHGSGEHPVLHELYRYTNLNVVNPFMLGGPRLGQLLRFIVYMLKPRLLLEIGTFTGYSTIAMALDAPEGAVIHTIEPNDELSEISTRFFRMAGVEEMIVMHTGRAQDMVPHLGLKFDMIFIDGDKREYPQYYRLAKSHLSAGGIIVADNVIWGGKVLDSSAKDARTDAIRVFNEMVKDDSTMEKLMLPLRDGITLIRRGDVAG